MGLVLVHCIALHCGSVRLMWYVLMSASDFMSKWRARGRKTRMVNCILRLQSHYVERRFSGRVPFTVVKGLS